MTLISKLKRIKRNPQIPVELITRHRKKVLEGEIFYPRIIHVETRSMCNGRCSFCAAAVQTNTRPDIVMPDELIDKIIFELKEINYPNRLSFYNNNEPFLDKRIFDIVAKARQNLPRAYLELKTNGKILNTGIVYKIFDAGLDTLYINDYQSKGKDGKFHHSPNIQKIKAELHESRRFKGHYEKGYYHSRIVMSLRDVNETLGNRAGTSPNGIAVVEPLHLPCLRPIEMLTIDPTGKVALCSEDLHFDEPMGNVREQKLFAIWNSPEYKKIRMELLAGNRNAKSTCQKCDYRGFTQEIVEEMSIQKPRRNLSTFLEKFV